MSIDQSKIAFTSDFRYMYVPSGLKGTVTVSTGTLTVTHNLLKVPLIDISVILPDGTRNPMYHIFTNAFTASNDTYTVEQQQMECTVSVTETQLTFSVYDGSGANRAVTYYYRIYNEELV